MMLELTALLAVIVSLSGPVLASFFTASIMRETKMTKVIGSRSQCDHCGHDLSPLELVPVLSFIWQRGRCSYCHERINVRIFISELLGLGMFTAFAYAFAVKHLLVLDSLPSIVVWVGISGALTALLYLAVYDLLTLTIPTPPLIFLLALSAGANIYGVLNPSVNTLALTPEWGLIGNVWAALVAGLGVWALVKITKEKGMGMGDVYLFAILGLFGGPAFTVSLIYLTIGLSLLFGLLQGVRLRRFRGVIVPLVPCIALAFAIALGWGDAIFQLLFPMFGY
jgi:prepilin signal peptidase PulO-like enzyme (type II secretory pathway)